MLKKSFIPPHLDRFPARAQLLCSGPNDTRPDQQGESGNMGGIPAAPVCAGIWIPETVTLEGLGKKEEWLQGRIAANPSILGLGDLSLIQRERKQPSGGRIDLLLRDDDNDKHYEVEVQRGATNPDHIIRTIEYWDVERRRYPQYSHCGVLVAEEITGRFFNVINLLNSSGQIPLMAVKLTVINSPCECDGIGLLFTKILGEFEFAPSDESGDEAQPATMEDWIARAGEGQMDFAGEIFRNIAGSGWSMNPTIQYLGMKNDSTEQVNAKFVVVPKRAHVWARFRMPQSKKWDEKLADVPGFKGYKPEPGWRCYRFKCTRSNFVDNQKVVLRRLFEAAVAGGDGEQEDADA